MELIERLVHENGVIVTISIVFITMSIAITMKLFSVMSSFQRENKAFVNSLNAQQSTLDKIYEALKPTTFMQSRDLIELVVFKMKYSAFDIYYETLKHNTLRMEGHESIIVETVSRKLMSVSDNATNTLQRTTFSGKTLDKFIPEWWPEATEVIHSELYNSNGSDKEQSKKNIFSVFDKVLSEAEKDLNNG